MRFLMKQYPALKRWLALVGTVAVLGVVVAVSAFQGGGNKEQPTKADKAAPWLMFGGHNSRNMVNTVDRNVPVEWDIKAKGQLKAGQGTILWRADLGSKA